MKEKKALKCMRCVKGIPPMNVGFEVELEIKGYDNNVWLCDWQDCVNGNKNRETINHFKIVKFTEFQLAIFNLTLNAALLIFVKSVPP